MSEANVPTTSMTVYEQDDSVMLSPVMDLKVAQARLKQFQEFVKGYLVENEDFGKIPGTPKPTLLKPGADKLCELYGLADEYTIEDKVEDYSAGLFDYTIKCRLTNRRTLGLVATGMGSCNSYEGKYRWRDSKPKCPKCSKETVFKSKQDDGFFCWARKGGCGAKFASNDPKITGQESGKVQNEDIATLKNTILKMAKKRAKVDATLSATRSSGIFTQDVEDFKGAPPEVDGHTGGYEEPPADHPAASHSEPTRQATTMPRRKSESTQDEPPASQAEEVGWEEPQGHSGPVNGEVLPPENVISTPQQKRLFAISRSAGLNDAQVKVILGKFGFQHSNTITKDKYNAIIDAVDPEYKFHERKQ